MEDRTYDVLILGGGIAGMTAAIYTARYNLKTAVISKEFGGAANLAGHVENWPGFIGSGMNLSQNVYKQAEEYEIEFIKEEFNNLSRDGNLFILKTENQELKSKALIITLGMQHRKLNIKGEKELTGKGVSYCATCDGMFFKDKTVTVIGGSDSAAKAILYLSEIAKKVYVSYRQGEMRCEPIYLDRIKKLHNVEIFYFTNPKEITGDKKVSEIILKKNNEENIEDIKLETDGIFIEIGATPMVDIVKQIDVNLDESGYIITDKNGKTNIDGVFAAGDNTNNKFKQLIVAAGEAAQAAKSAYDYIKFSKK